MTDRKIEVKAYSGYRGEESPRSFLVDGEEIDILAVADMWVEEGTEKRERKRYFKVKGSDGNVHTIYYDQELMEWFYRSSERGRSAAN